MEVRLDKALYLRVDSNAAGAAVDGLEVARRRGFCTKR